MLLELLRTKPADRLIADSQKEEHRLRKTLSAWDLTILGVGAIIGAGIFALSGIAAAGGADRPGAGPAITISFVLAAVTCGLAVLCFAGLASMIPVAGSAYTTPTPRWASSWRGSLVGTWCSNP